MIDFHSHILWGIDDGSRSLEETAKILESAKKVGFNKIISTSHYYINRYEVQEDERKKQVNKLNDCIKDIQIYLGSEIYSVDNIIELIKQHKASTINNSKYILIEFSLHTYTSISKEFIYKIVANDYIPIIAHPERYLYIQKHPEYVKELQEIGALFQSNYGSILGLYGGKAKRTLKKLLKLDIVSFFGSDVHADDKKYYDNVPKAIKKIRKIIPETRMNELTYLNAEKVLQNKIIN